MTFEKNGEKNGDTPCNPFSCRHLETKGCTLLSLNAYS